MTRRGFTMVELLVALVLFGVVSASLYQLLVSNQRLYNQQTQRVDLNANLRAAVALLPSELRELNAADPLSSDILAMSGDSIVYRAMRSVYFLCARPVISGATSGTVTLYRTFAYGLRAMDTAADGVILFAEANPTTRTDNFWLHATFGSNPSLGTDCNGQPSISVDLADVDPAGALVAVDSGAPLRSFEVMKVKTYPDARGDYWLGAQSFSQSGGWGDLQPILGPLAQGGLTFTYYDAAAAVTNNPALVARIEIRVIGETQQAVRQPGGMRRVVDTLVTQIALRNN